MAIAVLEGVVVGGMFAALETMIVPIVQTRLGASPSLVGLLTIIPMLVLGLTSPAYGRVIGWLGGNKRAVVITCALQVLGLAALSLPVHLPREPWSLPLAIALAVSISVVGSIGGPAWLAWMGGLVPRPLQGRYLGLRSRLFILCKLVVAIGFAGLMHELPAESSAWGLQLVLATAALSRVGSTLLLMRQHEPPPDRRPAPPETNAHHHASFLHFIRTMPATPLGRWTLVWAALHFGVMLAGPYFVSYMLSPAPEGLALEAGGFTYMALIYTAVVVRLLAYPLVGRLVDLFGPGAMLRVAVAGIITIPLAWALTREPWLIIAAEVVSGFCWCSAEIAVGVLLISCHRDPAERSRLIGYHQSAVNCVAACGAIAGSVLLAGHGDGTPLLPPIGDSSFHTLFILSTMLRLPALILAVRLLPGLRALRAAESAGLWRMLPGTGLVLTAGRGLVGFFRRPEG
jgi:MFS family permease